MKILLSAYACEPNKGSEPGVGWSWAIEVAKLGHDVWVLTRANNRAAIEAELAEMAPLGNLQFLYYDLPKWARRLKKIKSGIYPYYVAWQWGAYKLAQRVHSQEHFDRVHHVTFVSIRQPSFMGNLRIPFVFGPVAGGESAPWRLRVGYPLRGWILDGLRDIANILVRIDPLMRQTFRQAERICVTSEQTRALVPKAYRQKTQVQLAIALDEKWLEEIPAGIGVEQRKDGEIRLLYVGRFLYLKGMHLGLPAFARFVETYPKARLTMVGQGPEEAQWRKLTQTLGVEDKIDWVPWVSQVELRRLYLEHDVFFFPSLHDSGGMVVLEAMAHGLPVVCLDLGGPGMIVDDGSALVLAACGLTHKKAIKGLAADILALCDSKKLRVTLGLGGKTQAKKHSWAHLVVKVIDGDKPRSLHPL